MLEVSLFTAFLMGFLGGVHCVGMCGGIVAAFSFNIAPEVQNKFFLVVFYNIGRILSYSIAGALVAGIAAMADHLLDLFQLQIILQVFASFIMIALGLYLANWWHGLAKIEQLGSYLWKFISPLGKKFLPLKNPWQAFIFGMIWGWLPCGLVYSALLYALSSADLMQGTLIMLVFGLGTLPNLVLLGFVATSIMPLLQKAWVKSIAGLSVIGFGLYNLWLAYSFLN